MRLLVHTSTDSKECQINQNDSLLSILHSIASTLLGPSSFMEGKYCLRSVENDELLTQEVFPRLI